MSSISEASLSQHIANVGRQQGLSENEIAYALTEFDMMLARPGGLEAIMSSPSFTFDNSNSLDRFRADVNAPEGSPLLDRNSEPSLGKTVDKVSRWAFLYEVAVAFFKAAKNAPTQDPDRVRRLPENKAEQYWKGKNPYAPD
jgi:hypothetical protein